MLRNGVFIDAHSHILDERFDEIRDKLVEALKKEGLLWVENAVDLEQCETIVRFYKDEWLYAFGVHPHEASKYSKDLASLRTRFAELLKSASPVAVGEVGLDFYKNYSPPADQIKVFEVMLEIAESERLPVEIHCRACTEKMYQILEKYNGMVIFHSFTGSSRLFELGMEKGWYFSISAIAESAVLRQDERRARIYSSIPLERLLLETDSPYLVPRTEDFPSFSFVPEGVNTPTAIEGVAKILSRIYKSYGKNIQPLEIMKRSTQNAESVFKLSSRRNSHR